MHQVIDAFRHRLPDFVENVATQIQAAHVPVYAELPQHHVKEALYQAMCSLGADIAAGSAQSYADYWRTVAIERAQQGVLPSHSMQVTYLSSEVMTGYVKQDFAEQPEALIWWLERLHLVISQGMLAMTEARLYALRQLGMLQAPEQPLSPTLWPQPSTRPALVPQRQLWTSVQLDVPLLVVQTLGAFDVTCGGQPISAWGRRSAPLLLALLAIHADGWLQREQICDIFWPELELSAAEARFKVTLNALMQALSPQRSARQPSPYIERQGSAYRLASSQPFIQIDYRQFLQALDVAEATSDQATAVLRLTSALQRYAEFLPHCLYADWTSHIRDRLRMRYVSGATRLAELLIAQQDYAAARRWAEAALSADSCWEPAYQALLHAWHAEGNLVQVERTYARCSATLQQELDLPPSEAISALYRQLCG